MKNRNVKQVMLKGRETAGGGGKMKRVKEGKYG
jgi:hypothetical protein